MASAFFNRRVILAAALAVTLAPLGAVAQSSDEMATFICRRAEPSETATAKMIASSTQLVCRPFGVTVKMSDGTMKRIGTVTAKSPASPDLSNAVTPAQFSAAWTRWVQQALKIDPTTLHSP